MMRRMAISHAHPLLVAGFVLGKDIYPNLFDVVVVDITINSHTL